MRLEQLLEGARAIGAGAPADADAEAAGVEIEGLAYDSRQVHGGELFFCVSGFRQDGHEFAPQAVAAGARALVVERPLGLGVPEVRVPSVRAAMAPLAASFFGRPSRELKVAGVTGTNGKTTTTYLLRSLLEAAAGYPCGLLGTVKSVIAGRELEVARTTPEAIDLQADLRAMFDGGDRACAMEVSSHALELRRADAIEFAAAVFTNLTQDHLDFHPTMEDYFRAKRLLFHPAAGPPPAHSIVNVGDPYGRRLAAELPGRDHVRDRRGGRLRRRGRPLRAGPLELHAARRGRPPGVRAAAAGALQRRQRARGAGGGALARGRARAAAGARSSGASGCRDGSSRWTRANASLCSWTTPTRPTRSPTCWSRPAK